jgi:hypothetical protein
MSPRLVILALSLLVAPLAQAQDPAPALDIGLQVDGGSVLVSTGGEFVQAAPGQAVQPGMRVMLAEGASAGLDYGNGCSKRLAEPGVYTVTADCNPASARQGSPNTGLVVAGVVGGVAVVAAALGGGGGGDDRPPPPVSR